MPSDILIPATDEAVITESITIGERIVTFQIIGTLLAEESFAFEVEDPVAASGWRTLSLDSDEISIILGNDQVTFYAPAYVRINKTATDAACGLRTITGI